MSSPSAVVCREIFDENSQPSAEEVSEYAQQLGIDPESESHLLPLARDGLMQALPPPWKAYYDEKLQTHYYYNEETKKTQWEHPLDKVYKELVRKARDASMQDDTCASVQELLTYEENPKTLERVETKGDSDDEDLTTDSSRHLFESKQTVMPKRLAPLGRPPLAPMTRFDKKLSDLKISPLRRSIDNPLKPVSLRSERESFRVAERPKQLFKQQSEIIDLKINVLTSPEEDNFSPLLGAKLSKIDRGLPLAGKGSMFFKIPKSDNPSPDTDKSFPLDSMTKSDPPKGILREKLSETLQRKAESVVLGKGRQTTSLDEDRKSVRFKLENVPEPSTVSPGSNSSSDQNEGQSSIMTPVPSHPSPVSSPPLNPLPNPSGPVILSPISRPLSAKVDSPRGLKSSIGMQNSTLDGSRHWIGSRESLVDSDSETSSSTPSHPDNLDPDPVPNTEAADQRRFDSCLQTADDRKAIDNPEAQNDPYEAEVSRPIDRSELWAVKGLDSQNAEINPKNELTIDSLTGTAQSAHGLRLADNLKSREDSASNNSNLGNKNSPKSDNKPEENPYYPDSNSVAKIDEPITITRPEMMESVKVEDSEAVDGPNTDNTETDVDGPIIIDDSKPESHHETGVKSCDSDVEASSKDIGREIDIDGEIGIVGSAKSADTKTGSPCRGSNEKQEKSSLDTSKSHNVQNEDLDNSVSSSSSEPIEILKKKDKTASATSNTSKIEKVDNSISSNSSKESDRLKSNIESSARDRSTEPSGIKDNSRSAKEGGGSVDDVDNRTRSVEENYLKQQSLDNPKSPSTKVSYDEDSDELLDSNQSPKRRVVRPPAVDYIKPDLFQKNFHKISDLVRPGDIDTSPVHLGIESGDKDPRPRSPLIPQQKNKISINLMESIESETSTESPDKEYANLDLNDLDDSNDMPKDNVSDKDEENSPKLEANSDKSASSKMSNSHNRASSNYTQNKSPLSSDDRSTNKPQTRVPKLDLFLSKPEIQSPATDTKKSISDNNDKSPHEIKSPQIKSPKFDFAKPWSNTSSLKPLNKAVIAPLKPSDSNNSLSKNLSSPRLDGVILSQGKSSSDNVVIVYQFETQDEVYPKPVKSPLSLDPGRDMLERNKADERKRIELTLKKELESVRVEFATKERRMRAELEEELRDAQEKFLEEKRLRLAEQAERHKMEMENALAQSEKSHQEALKAVNKSVEEIHRKDIEVAEKRHAEDLAKLQNEFRAKLDAKKGQLQIENDLALSELRDQLQANLNKERARIMEENRAIIEAIKEDHNNKITDLKQDYRAEVERLRTQHACHLEDLRTRLAGERAARTEDRGLADKYKCLKEKYARLKHDVKMSIERRNKRREMSMTTGSETEKSNSHKATQSLERCKELNETSVSAVIESEPRSRNNNPNTNSSKNDNETSHSESNALKYDKYDNNNEDWRAKDASVQPATSSQSQSSGKRPHRRTMVAFKEPPPRSREKSRDKDAGATTDYQDSSDATTADEKPKDPVNGHGRRRCFTRLKSASTSRLNYSPKRGEGWSSPLEALRQQLRKLDDLEDQFPDLVGQPNYTMRYPFGEIAAVARANTPELEFVRHRAVVEREGMRRARAVLKRRRAALRETRDGVPAHNRAPSEERETTELEVALHRARALLGEKEIRLRHIERALRKLADIDDAPAPPLIQEATTSEPSSASEGAGEAEATGEVLRSLRALHADVRDIWRALDGRPRTASPETNSFNATTSSQNRMTLSAPPPGTQDSEVLERAKGLRAWLQTAP